MNLLQQFQQYIEQENLFSPADGLLLAVSGGADSVVLCELCHQAGFHFEIAHCNFQLRGQESDNEQTFVENLGKKYGVAVWVKKFDTTGYAATQKLSIQVAARELRYAWFDELLHREASDVNRESSGVSHAASDTSRDGVVGNPPVSGSNKNSGLPPHASRLMSHMLTAHHLDDNIETMLMNFFRGTGIAGLRGILPKHGKIVRPLLFANKETLLQFAAARQLSWMEDSSNQSDKYARNYFRHQVIPLLKNVYPEAEQNLAGNLQRFRDIELLYHQSVSQHKKKLLLYKENEVHIPVLKLQKTQPQHTIVYEIIKDFHFSAGQVPDVLSLLQSETSRYIQSATHRIIKNRNWLIISPNQPAETSCIVIDAPGKVEYGKGKLELEIRPNLKTSISSSPATVCLDAAGIKFPLLLRKWKAGDYFYPLGMPKKKKLSRFFIDQKLSKTAKEKVWVLEMNKKIIWVIGYRIDDRFKVTPSTRLVLQVVSETADV